MIGGFNLKRKRSKQCALCEKFFKNSEMSEEHYPAKSTGNEDIVALDLGKMVDSMMSGKVIGKLFHKDNQGKTLEEVSGNFFDEELAQPLYPQGLRLDDIFWPIPESHKDLQASLIFLIIDLCAHQDQLNEPDAPEAQSQGS